MNEPRRYDVDWTDESNPQIVTAQPGDELAMTLTEAQQVINDGRTEDAQHAAATVDSGLDRLFRRLGPPTDRTTEQ